MAETDLTQFKRVVERIIELAPEMYKTKYCMLEKIGEELNLDLGTLKKYVQTMKAAESNNVSVSREYLYFLQCLKDECRKNPLLGEKIRKAVELYGPYDAVEITEKIMDAILVLAKDETASRSVLAAQISAKLEISSGTFYNHLRTLRALQGGLKPSLNHAKEHYFLLKTRYERDHKFKEKADAVLKFYGKYDAVEITEKIMDAILVLAKDETANRGGLAAQISAKFEIDSGTIYRHMHTLRALKGDVKPEPGHAKELYPLLKTRYDQDGVFRVTVAKVLDVWDNAADIASVKNILRDMLKYAPTCKKTKKELKEYVAKKNGLSVSILQAYIQMMKTLAGTNETPPSSLRRLYHVLEYKYQKDPDFREKIITAVNLYGAVKEGKTISYEELLDQVGISLEKHKAQKPAGDKTEWVKNDLLKRVPLVAIEKLAGTNGTNALIMRAIADAKK